MFQQVMSRHVRAKAALNIDWLLISISKLLKQSFFGSVPSMSIKAFRKLLGKAPRKYVFDFIYNNKSMKK